MNDPIDNLRSANPVPTDQNSAHSARAEALFQEITMTDPNTINPNTIDPNTLLPNTAATTTSAAAAAASTSVAPQSAAAVSSSPFTAPPSREAMTRTNTRRRPSRKTKVGTAAAAAAAVIGFGTFSLIPGAVSPAAASMLSAAEQTQAADSGTVTVTLNVSEGSDAETVSLITNYSNDDLAARLEAGDFDLGPNTPEIRIVDDVIYVSDGDAWYSANDPRLVSLFGTLGLPTDVRQTMSAGVVELLERADDAVEVSDGVFEATVTVAEVQEVAEGFPGFGVVAGDAFGDEDLPADVAEEVLSLDVVLDADGLIDTVTLGADDFDDSAAGSPSVDAAVTIDFDDLDAGVTIVAPENAEEVDLDGFGGDLFGD